MTAFVVRAGYEVVGVFRETGSEAWVDGAERQTAMALAQRREIRHCRGCELHPADHRDCFAKIGLAVPGRVSQGNEHLLPTQPPLPNVVLHDRLATCEAVLRLEPLEDPPRRMPSLSRRPGP